MKVGDAVSFYVDEIPTKGIAMAVYREGRQWFVKVCPVRAAFPWVLLGFKKIKHRVMVGHGREVEGMSKRDVQTSQACLKNSFVFQYLELFP